MKIKFLGTAAAEAIPALFCECETCKKAWKNGGKDFRTRSQALIDDDLLIDFPCDTYSHVLKYKIDLLKIPYILITHVHADHYYIDDLQWHSANFVHTSPDWKGVQVCGGEDITENFLKDLFANSPVGKFAFNVLKPFEPVTLGEYTVIPLKATHGAKMPYVYIVSKGGKTLLYAHDTGIFREETWDCLKKLKPSFDLISLDCTEGAVDDISYDSHMCLGRNIRFRNELEKLGMLKENCIAVLNHFSHNGKKVNYDEFEPIARKEGFVTSYDGLEIEF